MMTGTFTSTICIGKGFSFIAMHKIFSLFFLTILLASISSGKVYGDNSGDMKIFKGLYVLAFTDKLGSTPQTVTLTQSFIRAIASDPIVRVKGGSVIGMGDDPFLDKFRLDENNRLPIQKIDSLKKVRIREIEPIRIILFSEVFLENEQYLVNFTFQDLYSDKIYFASNMKIDVLNLKAGRVSQLDSQMGINCARLVKHYMDSSNVSKIFGEVEIPGVVNYSEVKVMFHSADDTTTHYCDKQGYFNLNAPKDVDPGEDITMDFEYKDYRAKKVLKMIPGKQKFNDKIKLEKVELKRVYGNIHTGFWWLKNNMRVSLHECPSVRDNCDKKGNFSLMIPVDEIPDNFSGALDFTNGKKEFLYGGSRPLYLHHDTIGNIKIQLDYNGYYDDPPSWYLSLGYVPSFRLDKNAGGNTFNPWWTIGFKLIPYFLSSHFEIACFYAVTSTPTGTARSYYELKDWKIGGNCFLFKSQIKRMLNPYMGFYVAYFTQDTAIGNTVLAGYKYLKPEYKNSYGWHFIPSIGMKYSLLEYIVVEANVQYIGEMKVNSTTFNFNYFGTSDPVNTIINFSEIQFCLTLNIGI